MTVDPSAQPGNLLPHIVAGAAGELDLAWFHGVSENGGVDWYPTAAQTLDALDATPTFARAQLSTFPAYAKATASQMMGACGSGAAQGVENGFACVRSTDIWGVAIDNEGNFLVTWPGDGSEFNGSHNGTFVSMQTGGTTIAPAPAVQAPEAPWAPALLGIGGTAGLLALLRRRRR